MFSWIYVPCDWVPGQTSNTKARNAPRNGGVFPNASFSATPQYKGNPAAECTEDFAMSNTRTGYLTPPHQRRYSTGDRDVDTPVDLDNVSLSRRKERKAFSESSREQAEASEASYGDGNQNWQSMKTKAALHHVQAKIGNERNAFEVHGNSTKDQDTGYAGSWCEKNITIAQTSDFLGDPAFGPHHYTCDGKVDDMDTKIRNDENKFQGGRK